MAQSADLRKLKHMITDLTAMKRELLNEGDSSSGAKPDTFEGQYHVVSQLVASIKADADHLQELKKSKGQNYRDQTTISLRSQISTNSKKASELIGDLAKMAEKEEKKLQKILKKGKTLKKEDEKKQEEHLYHTQVIKVLRESLKLVDELVAPESAELRNFRTSRRTRELESKDGDESSNRDTHDSGIRRRSANRPRSARRRQKMGLDPLGDIIEEVPEESDENVRAWMSAVEDNRKEQDAMLSKISDGLDDLKRMAEDMNSEFTKQKAMLDTLDQKMDDNIEKFRTSNGQLKDLLKKSGGCSRWGVVLILCLVLLGLVGAIFIL